MSDEQIKALIEAGDKATQGEWKKHASAHSDVGYIDGVYIKGLWFFEGNDTQFIIQAANSREAIQSLHEEVLELRGKIRAQEECIGDWEIAAPVLKTILDVAGLKKGVSTCEGMMVSLEYLATLRKKTPKQALTNNPQTSDSAIVAVRTEDGAPSAPVEAQGGETFNEERE